MKQLLITFAVAIIGFLVLTQDVQLVLSKAVAPSNQTNQTNSSAQISGLSQNLSHALELIANLTHQLEVLNHTSINSTGPTQNATQNSTQVIHKAPVVLVNQTHVGALNQSNSSSVPSQNLSQTIDQILKLSHQLELLALNQTNSTGPAQNGTQNSTQVAQLNVTQVYLLTLKNSQRIDGLAQNVSRLAELIFSGSLNQTQNSTRVIHKAPVVIQTQLVGLNQTNSSSPSGNSSLVPQLNVTQLYQITLKNSQRIDSLAQNVSRLAELIFSGGSLNQTQNSTANSSLVIHKAPVVNQIPDLWLAPLNATNSTGPVQNTTRIVQQAPVVVLNSTLVHQNATQVHLNSTQVSQVAQNLTHLQELIGNLTHQVEQLAQVKLH